jgi:hypothetical protein
MSVIFIVDVRSADTICIHIKNVCYLRLKSIIINGNDFFFFTSLPLQQKMIKKIIIIAAVEDRQQTEKRQ